MALAFVDAPPPPLPSPLPLSDDADLALRALALQALEGPCTVPRPAGPGWLGGGGGAETAAAQERWAAWKELDGMPGVEAMRLYVRVLDEEVPGWWTAAEAAGIAGAVVDGFGGGSDVGMVPPTHTARPLSSSAAGAIAARPPPAAGAGDDANTTAWEAVRVASSSATPPPRYEHAACLVAPSTLLVAGGCGPGGRVWGDAWALNLEELTWARASPRTGSPGALPPRTGLALIPWGEGGALAVGGHAPRAEREAGTAPPFLDLFSFDPASGGRWSALPTVGPGPSARGGHVAVRVGPRTIVVWGGEPSSARGGGGGRRSARSVALSPPTSPAPSVFSLDVPTLTWTARTPTGKTPPPPLRSGAAGAAVRGRWVVLFGGADEGDGGRLSAEVAVLDTRAWAWVAPAVSGPTPPPRAGHAAALLGRSLFVVGGGDDGAAGRADAWCLDCSGLPASLSWSPAAPPAPAAARAAASEGTALVALPAARALLAVGGNAGRLHAELAVLRPSPAAAAGWGDDDDEGEERAAPAVAPPPSSSSSDPSELVLTRRQLASAQAAAADAAGREEAALGEAAAERAGRASAEAEVERLKREVARWRAVAEAAGAVEPEEEEREAEVEARPARGLWAFVSGAPK